MKVPNGVGKYSLIDDSEEQYLRRLRHYAGQCRVLFDELNGRSSPMLCSDKSVRVRRMFFYRVLLSN
jgi:hypothetical protein